MNPSIKRLILIVIVILGLGSILTKNYKNWTGDAADESNLVAAKEQISQTESETGNSEIPINPIQSILDISEIRLIVQTLSPENRKAILADSEKFQAFIQRQLAQKSMLNLLMADGVKDQEPVQFLMQKSAEKALLEWYLNQLILKNLAKDFPNEQQIKEFYDSNQETFTLGERVHLWQILLPFLDNASNEEIAKLESEAKKIRDDIVSKRISFADAALQYSKNSPSRENGGYVGLVKLDEFPENLKQEILALSQDDISQPIRTGNAFHIIKHGSIVAEQSVELEQISGRIREVLRKQEVENIRKALIEQAQKKFPTDIEASDIEEWRLKLRSGL